MQEGFIYLYQNSNYSESPYLPSPLWEKLRCDSKGSFLPLSSLHFLIKKSFPGAAGSPPQPTRHQDQGMYRVDSCGWSWPRWK